MERRVAVVTGASRGIGLSVSLELLRLGYTVAAVGSSTESFRYNPRSEVEESGHYKRFFCNLVNENEIIGLAEDVTEWATRVDVLVNVAGRIDIAQIESATFKSWDEVIAVNLRAPYFLVKAFLACLKVAEHGRIINISSNAGRMGGVSNGLAYSASKGGLISLTYGLASRLAQYGITANTIAPGPVSTDMLSTRAPSELENIRQRIPLGRFGHCDEVSNAVAYFASPESSYTTGSVLDVNGGLFMG